MHAETVATNSAADHWYSAVVGSREMRQGVHCAHFTIRDIGGNGVSVAVVAERYDCASMCMTESPYAWSLWTGVPDESRVDRGWVYHNDDDEPLQEWPGRPERLEFKEGDVIVRDRAARPCHICGC